MTLTEDQVEYIATNLKFYGIESDELRADVLDHVCSHIESGEFEDFDQAYNSAIQQFGGYRAMSNIERDTYLMVSFKNNLLRQKFLYFFGCLSIIGLVSGISFKFMHWPGANLLFFSGCTLVAVAFVPLYFYQRYRNFYRKSIAW